MGIEPNMEWIECTVCEIFTFKLYSDLDTKVRGNSRSPKAALFDRADTNLYSSSTVNMSLYYGFQDIAAYWIKIATPVVFGAAARGETVRFTQQTLVTKTRIMGLSDSERISMTCSAVLIKSTCVTDGRTVRWTDGLNCRTIYEL